MQARKMFFAAVGLAAILFVAAGAMAVNIETVPVGDIGNAADTAAHSGNSAGQGSVGYAYSIGKYEVTAGQYAAFLNAVAATDTYSLYNTSMDTAVYSYGCNIKRAGSAGSYTYSVASDWANRPVNSVSYWDACRFANWLSNGQPTGLQGAGTTETGTYTLGGYNGKFGQTIQRNAGATWAVTSEDEWYKAAYYKAGGTNAGYWDYPTRSNTAPSNVGSDGYTDPGNHANYYNNVYTIGSQYYRTNVGEFENSASPYGTFDQGGNVWEWNEAIPYQDSNYAYRGLRGGSFGGSDVTLLASYRFVSRYPAYEDHGFGFRVSEVPEPASLVILGLGAAGLLRRGRGLGR